MASGGASSRALVPLLSCEGASVTPGLDRRDPIRLAQLGRRRQGNVGRQHQRPAGAARRAQRRCRSPRAALSSPAPGSGTTVAPRLSARLAALASGVTTTTRSMLATLGDGGQHVLQHGEHQPAARRVRQHRRQPALGLRQRLHRHDRVCRPAAHGCIGSRSRPRVRASRSQKARHWRASATLSSSVRIMVLVTIAGIGMAAGERLVGACRSRSRRSAPHNARRCCGCPAASPSSAMILAAGPLTALPAMMGDTAMTGTPLRAQGLAHARHRQDRLDAEPRVRRADDDAGQRRRRQGLEHLRRGPRPRPRRR